MSKHVVNNEKNRLIADIKKTWASALSDAKSSMDKAIYTGELLTKLKEKVGHGGWLPLFKKDSNTELECCIWVPFSEDWAQKLMRVYANKELIKIATDGEVLTIYEAINAIKTATPEQIAEAEELKAKQAEADKREAYRKELLKKDAEAKKAKAEQDKKDGIIDGEFSEVKPAPANEPEKINIEPVAPKAEPEKTAQELAIDEFEELLDEQISMNKALEADNKSLVLIFESDDKLAVAVEELKKANALIIILEGRINGMMNEKNAAVRHAQMYKNRLEKLEKSLQTAV